MNPWEELFQGEVADEFSSMLAADFSESLNLAAEEKENTGYTCARSCSCGPEVCGKELPKDPGAESAVHTSCRTCAAAPDGCGDVKKASDDFSPRIPGWSTPPNYAAL